MAQCDHCIHNYLDKGDNHSYCYLADTGKKKPIEWINCYLDEKECPDYKKRKGKIKSREFREWSAIKYEEV